MFIFLSEPKKISSTWSCATSHSTQPIPQGPQRLSCSVLEEGQGNEQEVEGMEEDCYTKAKQVYDALIWTEKEYF